MSPQDYIPTQMPTLTVNTRDARSCKEIVASLPLTNVSTAHGILRALLDAVKKAPPPPTDYLSVLEHAREPLAFLQEAMAARYAAKPLPAGAEETSAFERTVGLWRLMANGYAQVAQIGGGEADIQKQLGLICERCIHYSGRMVVEYYRAHRALAEGVWLELHGYQDTADDWGLAGETVAEPLGIAAKATTPTGTYGAVLLIGLANPYGRTAKELAWISRWAELLAPQTAIRRPDEEAGKRGYGIDLMRDQGPLPVENMTATASARLFDTSQVGERVQQLLARLKAGETPAALGLGEDCPPAYAARLLRQIYRPWALAAMPRRFERSHATGIIAASYGLESIYYHVTGGDFIQPEHARSYSRADVEKLWTFRNQLDPTQPLQMHAAELSFALDTWDIADRSPNGFRVFRSAAGPRVEHGQLLAFKQPDSKEFHLGLISWLVQERDGRLQAGVNVLPGPARGIAVRPSGVAVSRSEKYLRAFFIPAVASIKEPVSVIIPPGWYQPGRIVEVFTDRSVMVRLDELLGRGPNFDRCSFALAA